MDILDIRRIWGSGYHHGLKQKKIRCWDYICEIEPDFLVLEELALAEKSDDFPIFIFNFYYRPLWNELRIKHRELAGCRFYDFIYDLIWESLKKNDLLRLNYLHNEIL